MQIVIDIPEEIVKNDDYVSYFGIVSEKLIETIKNGTLLPKGHGRLIDTDELKRHKYHDNNRFENAVAVAQIDWADTIIEADKGQR